MQNITITTSPAPSFPASLRSAESGDFGGTATWEAQTEDIADAVGHLKATKADAASGAHTGTTTVEALTASGLITANGGITVPSGDTATFASGSTFANAAAETRTGALTKSGTGATTAERTNALSTTSLAVTLDVGHDIHYLAAPSGVGVRVYTLKSTSSAPPAGAVMTVVAYGLGLNQDIDIQREGGTSIVSMAGSPSSLYFCASFVFVGSSWRLLHASGTGTITYGSP